ncbi:MAG: IPT/TIG domain-containing protein [Candidatus Hydrogenedentes bacterium]|nr:IPT/TIG domain-containing protein [Candidatus Hydrogenedentota bacterium]
MMFVGSMMCATMGVPVVYAQDVDAELSPDSVDFDVLGDTATVTLTNNESDDWDFVFANIPAGITIEGPDGELEEDDDITVGGESDEDITLTLNRSQLSSDLDDTVEINVGDTELTIDVTATIGLDVSVEPDSIDFDTDGDTVTATLTNNESDDWDFEFTNIPAGITIEGPDGELESGDAVTVDAENDEDVAITLNRSQLSSDLDDTIEINIGSTTLTIDVTATAGIDVSVAPTSVNFDTLGDDVILTLTNDSDATVTFSFDTTTLLGLSVEVQPSGVIPVASGATGQARLIFDRSSLGPGESFNTSFAIDVLDGDNQTVDTLSVPIRASVSNVVINSVDPNTGPSAGGTDVIILGSNFTDPEEDESEPTVMFGTEEATVIDYCSQCVEQVIDSVTVTLDKIYVISPPSVTGPGPVDVVVTNNDTDETGSLADGFTYGGPDEPQLDVSDTLVVIDYNETEKDLRITNTSGGVLDWTINWTIGNERIASIVYADPVEGSLPGGSTDVVTFTADDKSALEPGETLQGTMTLASTGGTVEITVIVVRATEGVLAVSPSELLFEGAVGDEIMKTIDIANQGQNPINWVLEYDPNIFTAVPTAGTLDWSESAQQITTIQLTVDFSTLVPETVIHTSVRIVNADDTSKFVRIPVTIRVKKEAELDVFPLSLYFSLSQFNMNDDVWHMPNAINVRNLGETDLRWTASSGDPVNVSTSPTTGTISGSDLSGEPNSVGLDVIVNSAGLPFATPAERIITRTITIEGAGKQFDVTLTIERPDPPIFEAVPASLDFGETINTLLLNIHNVGSAPMKWQYVQNGAFTLSVTSGTVIAGTDGAQVAVTLNRKDLAPAKDLVTSIDFDIRGVGPVSIPVRFSIPGPVMKIDPYQLTFETGETTKSFFITNDYKGILQWQKVGDASHVAVDKIFGQLGSGSGGTEVTVTVDRTGLPGGVHTFFITVQSNGSVAPIDGVLTPLTAWTTDTYRIPVNIVVPNPEPTLSVAPASLTFEQDETVKTINVTNVGVDILRWELSVSYGTDNGRHEFLKVNPTTGFTEHETDVVNVIVDRTNLDSGTHLATITFTPLTGGSSPISVPVSVVVGTGSQEPMLDVSPKTLTFGLTDDVLELDVRNLGGQFVSWSAVPVSPFIDISPKLGQVTTGPQKVQVKVDRSMLNVPLGETATGAIQFTSNAGEATVTVVVETVRAGDPKIAVAPFNLAFVRGVNVQSFVVRNDGGGKLIWTASATGNLVPGLLTTDTRDRLAAGGTVVARPDQIVVAVDKHGLKTTTTGIINIFSNTAGGSGQPYRLAVTIEPDETDQDAPILEVRPLEVRLPSDRNVSNILIRNSGAAGSTLDWTVDTASLPVFITVDKIKGSTVAGQTDIVRLRVVRSWIPPGTHRARLVITSTGGTAAVEIEVQTADIFARPGSVAIGSNEDTSSLNLVNLSAHAVSWSATTDKDYLSVEPVSGVVPDDEQITLTVTIDRDALDGEVNGTITIVANGQAFKVPVRPKIGTVTIASPEPNATLAIVTESGSMELPGRSVGDLGIVAETDSVFDTAQVRFKITSDEYGTADIGTDDTVPFGVVLPETLNFYPGGPVSVAELVGHTLDITATAESRFSPGLEVESAPRSVTVAAADGTLIETLDIDGDGQVSPAEAFVDTDGNRLFDIGRYDYVGDLDTDNGPARIVYAMRTFMPGQGIYRMVAPDGTSADIPAAIIANIPVQVLLVTAPDPETLEYALDLAGRPIADDAAALAADPTVGVQMGLRCAAVEIIGASAPLSLFGGVTLGIPYADSELNGFIDGTTMAVADMVPVAYAEGVNATYDAVTSYSLDEPARRGVVVTDRDAVITLVRESGSGTGSESGTISDWISDLIDIIMGH